jgi:hypothetical protein
MTRAGAQKAAGLGLQQLGSYMGLARDPEESQREVDMLKFEKLATEFNWEPERLEYAVSIYDAGGVNTPEGATLLAQLNQILTTKGAPPEETETITTSPEVSREVADVAAQVAQDAVVDETVPPQPVPEETNSYIIRLEPLFGRPTNVKVTIDRDMTAEDVRNAAKEKFARSKYKELMAEHPGLTRGDIKKLKKAYIKLADKMTGVTRPEESAEPEVGLSLQETILRLTAEIREEQRK